MLTETLAIVLALTAFAVGILAPLNAAWIVVTAGTVGLLTRRR